jgi:hypothetical protein
MRALGEPAKAADHHERRERKAEDSRDRGRNAELADLRGDPSVRAPGGRSCC